MLKRVYYMTNHGMFCTGCTCDKQMRDTFQPSHLTAVKLLAVITLQRLW